MTQPVAELLMGQGPRRPPLEVRGRLENVHLTLGKANQELPISRLRQSRPSHRSLSAWRSAIKIRQTGRYHNTNVWWGMVTLGRRSEDERCLNKGQTRPVLRGPPVDAARGRGW